MPVKKILKDWCDEYQINYEAAKKARQRVSIGERIHGYIYMTKKEFNELRKSMRNNGKSKNKKGVMRCKKDTPLN